MSSICCALTSAETKAHRELAMLKLMAMMNSQTEDDIEEAYSDFQSFNGDYQEVWDSSALIAYFKEYLNKKMEWSSAWRQVKSLFMGIIEWFSVTGVV
jgi:predicted sugar kinase